MQIQYININQYKYRVEFIPYEETQPKVQKEYIMLRNFETINDIVSDNNIYFIEKSLYEKYREILKNKDENNEIVFPSNKNTMYYSTSYSIFNETYFDNDFINQINKYKIYKKTIEENTNKYKFEPEGIPCNLVKIYHPHLKVHENFIIHIENIVNNIHFHYLCNTYDWFRKNNLYNSETEYQYEHNIYSEYIMCYIPDTRELFDRIIVDKDIYDYNWYFKENLNIVENKLDSEDPNISFLNDIVIKLDSNGEVSNDEGEIVAQYVPIALFTQPSKIEQYESDIDNDGTTETLYKKVYVQYHYSIDNNYITTPLNISLYPYQYIDSSTNIYILHSELLPGTCSILQDYKFLLNSKLEFDDKGILSIFSYFDYPLKELFQRFRDHSLTEAYCFYHHITNRSNTYLDNMKEIYMNELDEINSITDIDDETIDLLIKSKIAGKTPEITSECPTSKDYYIAKLKESRWQVFLEEYMDEYKASIDFFGFRIEIASDKDFKHLIFQQNISLLDFKGPNQIIQELEDDNPIFGNLANGEYFFPLINIFDNWKQMPHIVVGRIIFIDRYIGNEIVSNDVFISKEKFKYIVNKTGIYQLTELKRLNENMKEIDLNNLNIQDEFNDIVENLDSETKNKLNSWFNKYNQFSFINKINCNISNIKFNDKIINNGGRNNQIIYKPIFFSTNKLNNINIKYNQNQNIGIDLHEYISKVDLFVMTISDNTYYEIGRNSNYVLFNINSSMLNDESGTFEIYNNNHEYITYGSWTMIR